MKVHEKIQVDKDWSIAAIKIILALESGADLWSKESVE